MNLDIGENWMPEIQCWGSVEYLLCGFIWRDLERLEHTTICSLPGFCNFCFLEFRRFQTCQNISHLEIIEKSQVSGPCPIPDQPDSLGWGLGWSRSTPVLGNHRVKALTVPEKRAREQQTDPWLQRPLQPWLEPLYQMSSSFLQGMCILILRGI